jgi:hypothetical protein
MGIESIRSTPLNFRTNAIGIVHTADFVGEDSANAAWNTLEDILPSGQGGLIFNAHRDLTVPPFILAESKKDWIRKSFKNCDFLAMFLGSKSARPIREQLFSLFANHSDFLIGSAYGKEYERAFLRSKFCLVIRGLTVWTRRISEVFVFPCIPVIVSNGYIPPFSSSIDWKTFSVRVREEDIEHLPQILGSISEEKWNYLNYNLLQVRKHFLYNNPPLSGDAFHMILYEVWQKVKGWKNTEI